MRIRNAAILFFALTFALLLGDLAYHYPLLPERVATHFDAAGRPNGWMSKAAFALFAAGITAFVDFAMLGSALTLRYTPSDLINLPNKDYWLAPERREETLAALTDSLLWMGAATQALLAAVFHLVYRANLLPEPRLSGSVWVLLAAFLAFMAMWTVGLVRRFAARPDA